MARTRSDSSPPTIAAIASKLMFSSCSPSSALVAGVKIGSGSRSLSSSPAGSLAPQTDPVARYSFQPEPER